jgi:hypothetical protein
VHLYVFFAYSILNILTLHVIICRSKFHRVLLSGAGYRKGSRHTAVVPRYRCPFHATHAIALLAMETEIHGYMVCFVLMVCCALCCRVKLWSSQRSMVPGTHTRGNTRTYTHMLPHACAHTDTRAHAHTPTYTHTQHRHASHTHTGRNTHTHITRCEGRLRTMLLCLTIRYSNLLG